MSQFVVRRWRNHKNYLMTFIFSSSIILFKLSQYQSFVWINVDYLLLSLILLGFLVMKDFFVLFERLVSQASLSLRKAFVPIFGSDKHTCIFKYLYFDKFSYQYFRSEGRYKNRGVYHSRGHFSNVRDLYIRDFLSPWRPKSEGEGECTPSMWNSTYFKK